MTVNLELLDDDPARYHHQQPTAGTIYGFNRWIYRTRNVRRLAVPVPCRGAQSIGWTVPPDVEAKVRSQLL